MGRLAPLRTSYVPPDEARRKEGPIFDNEVGEFHLDRSREPNPSKSFLHSPATGGGSSRHARLPNSQPTLYREVRSICHSLPIRAMQGAFPPGSDTEPSERRNGSPSDEKRGLPVDRNDEPPGPQFLTPSENLGEPGTTVRTELHVLTSENRPRRSEVEHGTESGRDPPPSGSLPAARWAR